MNALLSSRRAVSYELERTLSQQGKCVGWRGGSTGLIEGHNPNPRCPNCHETDRQLLLGHMSSKAPRATSAIEVDDALAISEQVELQFRGDGADERRPDVWQRCKSRCERALARSKLKVGLWRVNACL